MKRPLLHSLLICALLAGLCAVWFVPTGSVHAISTLYNLGVNGIANAGAENSLSYWDNTGTVQVIDYGTTRAPGYGDPGPENRGSRLFWGSYSSNSPTTMTQRIELSYDLRQRVQEGDIAFDLSGYLGGYGTELDYAQIVLVFEKLTGSEIKRLEMPPVTAADRGNKTSLLYRKLSGMVPSDTAYFEVEITFNDETHDQSNNYNFAFVDNVSLVLRRNALFTPFIVRPQAPPAAPGELIVTPGSSTVINLYWYDNSNNETGFQIERAPINTSAFALIATTGANETSYQDRNLAPATGYSYRVRAVGPTGASGYTQVKSATTFPTTPAAPTNLGFTGLTQTGVTLTWTDNASNESGFELEQSINGGTFTKIISWPQLPINTSQTTLTTLTPGTAYDFRVRAVNQGGASAYSNTVHVVTQSPPVQPPAAPTNLFASGTTSSATTLSWTDNANNETGYELQMATGAGGFIKILGENVLTPNTAQTTVSTLRPGTTYKFRVRAINQSGNSAYSNEVQVTTQGALPAAPSLLAYSNLSSTTVTLTWVDNANNETWFDVQEKIGTGAWTTISDPTNLPADYVFANITDLIPNTDYAYRIRAVNNTGASAFSNTVSFHTPSGSGQTILRVFNNGTVDWIISLKINNVEYLPTPNDVISMGYYKDFIVNPGPIEIVATTGLWDSQANPPQRIPKYEFSFGGTKDAGTTETVTVNDPTIDFLLTYPYTLNPVRRAWIGTYWIGTTGGVATFCFYPNGKYLLYDNGRLVNSGPYTMVKYGSILTYFQADDPVTKESYIGKLNMVSGGATFTMENGPPSWRQITYTWQTDSETIAAGCPASVP